MQRRWVPIMGLTLLKMIRLRPFATWRDAVQTIAFVAVGHAGAVTQAMDCLAPGGTCVIIGLPATGSTAGLDLENMVRNERIVRGCKYGSARIRDDFPRMVELYLGGKLKIDELITKRYDLEEGNEAFADLASGANARGLIVF
jgi:S-(hydroxymethyl)glutathione dehydrogenase/alcohol dehydrogenase